MQNWSQCVYEQRTRGQDSSKPQSLEAGALPLCSRAYARSDRQGSRRWARAVHTRTSAASLNAAAQLLLAGVQNEIPATEEGRQPARGKPFRAANFRCCRVVSE